MDLTAALKVLAKRRSARLAHMDPAHAQEACLLDLVRRAENTKFGRDHDFAGISCVTEFQNRVPIRPFEDLWKDYWEASFPVLDDISWPGRIPYFAKTSGTTTGVTKHIPVTQEIIRSNEKAGFDLMTYHLAHNPQSKPLSGKTFIIAGSTALQELAPGVLGGDVSGMNTRNTPFWIKRRIFPSPEHALISSWDEKLDTLSRLALDQRITMVSGMCNWVLIMLDRIRDLKEARGGFDGPTLPDLQLMIHSGVPMELYRDRLERHLAGAPVECRELYAASEGFIACADRGAGEGMRLMLDSNLFLEFVPVSELGSDNPTRHWVKTIERNVDYALVLSNCAGLWSYLLGDVVRFVDTAPPRLHIMGRVSQMLSPFGEHLIGAEIEEAVGVAAAITGISIGEYSVGPVLPSGAGATGYHVYLIEAAGALRDSHNIQPAQDLATAIDRVLIGTNEDYACQRAGNAGLAPPEVRWLPPGTFESWMRSHGKMGGQHKIPRVTPKVDRFAGFSTELGIDLTPQSEEAYA
tara:strand:+ start:1814 stop:3379 length:1566 start_codon:yes stop_codon:yes gene_type:complete